MLSRKRLYVGMDCMYLWSELVIVYVDVMVMSSA